MTVEGTVWEVVWNWDRPGFDGNTDNLTLTGANVTLVGNVTYYNLTDTTGYYTMEVAPGTYNLSASLAGFVTETRDAALVITGTETKPVVRDFIGVYGLEPEEPFYTPKYALSYTLKAVNCMLVKPSVPEAELTSTEVANVTACWLATP